jgi:hypothetical protein
MANIADPGIRKLQKEAEGRSWCWILITWLLSDELAADLAQSARDGNKQ